MNLEFFAILLIFASVLTVAGVIRREYAGLVIIAGTLLILTGLFSIASPLAVTHILVNQTLSSQKVVDNITSTNISYHYITTSSNVLSTANGQDIISLILILLGAAMGFGVLFGRRNQY
jgi:hypothetical protein